MEPVALVLLVAFLAPAAVAPAPAQRVVDVAQWLEEIRAPRRTGGEADEREEKPWSTRVIHRDGLGRGNATTYERRLAQKLARDAARMGRLQRLAGRPEADFGAEIASGLAEGSGEYFARIGVGTPAREQLMVLDTGSDVVWIQCRPCAACYAQADPVFDPALSASFAAVPCASAVCGQVDGAGCGGGGRCVYRVAYGDGSSTLGTFATETLAFGATSVRNVAIGCGHDNEGLFVGAAGLLGLGAGALSFPNQLGTQTARAFSYCLVDRGAGSSSTLLFGPRAVPAGGGAVVFTPLVRNPRMPTYYYVGLAGISVGGAPVAIPAGVFELDRATGGGGVIVDSGTAVTRLRAGAYDPTRDAFVAATGHLPRADGVSLFDTCYDLSGRRSVSVPTVAFHFVDGGALSLPAKNYLIPVDAVGTFCLAFAPAPAALSSISIIGNVQQQGIRVSFDAANSLVGFALDQC